jgi:hypothetical protein
LEKAKPAAGLRPISAHEHVLLPMKPQADPQITSHPLASDQPPSEKGLSSKGFPMEKWLAADRVEFGPPKLSLRMSKLT